MPEDIKLANYIIQVNIVHPSVGANRLGCITLWEKNGRFGMSDSQMLFCPKDGCLGFRSTSDKIFTDEEEQQVIGNNNFDTWPKNLQVKFINFQNSHLDCPICKLVFPRYTWADKYIFNMPVANISKRLTDFFRLLDSDADVYLVRSKHANFFDKAAGQLRLPDMSVSKYNATLEKARTMDQVFYQLKNIERDVSAGSSLESRFKFMLEA